VSVGVRPEQFVIGGGEAQAEGKATLVEYLGSESYVHVRLESGRMILVHVPAQQGHRLGDKLTVGMERAHAHYFDGDGLRLPLFDDVEAEKSKSPA
jgi:ABC-type sugar transport system ATPase subunit